MGRKIKQKDWKYEAGKYKHDTHGWDHKAEMDQTNFIRTNDKI